MLQAIRQLQSALRAAATSQGRPAPASREPASPANAGIGGVLADCHCCPHSRADDLLRTRLLTKARPQRSGSILPPVQVTSCWCHHGPAILTLLSAASVGTCSTDNAPLLQARILSSARPSQPDVCGSEGIPISYLHKRYISYLIMAHDIGSQQCLPPTPTSVLFEGVRKHRTGSRHQATRDKSSGQQRLRVSRKKLCVPHRRGWVGVRNDEACRHDTSQLST